MNEFQIGELYFWIQYADRERLLLTPESIVFLGKNLNPTMSGDWWHFQDAKSYCIYGPETYSEAFDKELTEEEFAKIANKDLPTTLVNLQREDLYHVVDCHGLAKAASECAMRRSNAGKPT